MGIRAINLLVVLAVAGALCGCDGSSESKRDGYADTSPSYVDLRATIDGPSDEDGAASDSAAPGDSAANGDGGPHEGGALTDGVTMGDGATASSDRGTNPDGMAPGDASADVTTDTISGGWDPNLGTWEYLGGTAIGQGLSGVVVDFCQLTLDKAGNPIAAYSQKVPEPGTPKVVVKKWSGSAFVALGGSSVAGTDVDRIFTLGNDGSDNIWIATTGAPVRNGMAYHYGKGAWQAPTMLTTDKQTSGLSLTINAAGHPVVAYRFWPDGASAVGLQSYDGSSWRPSTPPSFVTSTNNKTAITLVNDVPYLYFADSMEWGHVITNTSGNSWERVGASPIHSRDAVRSAAMDSDAKGRPWIVFRSHAAVVVMYLDGGVWKAIDTTTLRPHVDTSSAFNTMDIKLMGNVPVISFTAVLFPKGIRVLAWVAAEKKWVPLGGAKLAAVQHSTYSQLAVSDDNKIYLGYRDRAAGDKMSIKVYTPGP